ncbi:putative efflux protein MATE family [Firmicutes bacterium CAG:124]|nr:putative efflux protein MATE family [Firmicutes bacterium CAG:124]
MNKDLTTGKPEKVLWQFCLPLFGSIIFQQLYNIADSFVAGKFISDNALAAVGNSYEITLIFIAFAFGCNIACSVLAALFFGAKQYNDLKTTVYTALISSCVICAVLMLVGTLCCDSLLRLIKTPEEVFADSKLYLDIYIYGLPFVFLYNVATGIFSALGDSKTPFIFLACSSTSNIAVDILFVTAFNMGVAGVAWATFLCQGISCVLALVVVFRRFAKIPTEGKVKIFSWNHFGRFAVIAIPSILQQSFISVGNIIIQSVINSFGAAVMAGYSAAVKLNNMVITSLTTLGNGISNYTAQNLGASKYDRIKSGFRAGIKLVWALCVPLVALYVFAGQPLVHIFLDSPTGQAMDTGVEFLGMIMQFYFFVYVHRAVLLHRVCQARLRRCAPRRGPYEEVHDCDVHRSGAPRGAGRNSVPHGARHDRHLELLAHRLDDRSGALDRVLRDCPLGKGLYSGINQKRREKEPSGSFSLISFYGMQCASSTVSFRPPCSSG